MRPAGRLSAILLVTTSLVLSGCEHERSLNAPDMSTLAPRLQVSFEKMKSVCFGRFLVDVPASAAVVWGHASMELGVDFYPAGANQVMDMAKAFSENLKNTHAIHLDNIPIFLAEEEITQPPGTIISGLEGFDAINGLKIEGYFRWGGEGLVISARPLREDRADTIAEMKSIVRRLRRRDENEVPREAGNCLEYAFLADKSMTGNKTPIEHVRIGFRLKEFPDTHLSIYIGPSNPHYSEGNSLEWQLARLEERQRAEDPNHPLLQTKYFRRGERKIHQWLNGWEAVSRSPDRDGFHGTHEFVMHVRGVPKDVYKPYANIQMQTGIKGNTAGAIKPTLTDEEAVAVWDRITSSIRVRPTSSAPSNANDKG
ncbi:T6SS immunity protein Tli4 family protein [Pseudoduganella buxea]|uniref:Tle cognate immunity protein 4 C-terminal domain-containing protein n=1 Tax=Pseudoduganella buxea TaxID=1949069 RepID=A0A6I3SX40_9BURK|nr:T6SS immunity protein Tli4 family protein [Pseudoduganella buxea]MTV53871.1 hypothetical protein [Pseudoduganella buxea]